MSYSVVSLEALFITFLVGFITTFIYKYYRLRNSSPSELKSNSEEYTGEESRLELDVSKSTNTSANGIVICATNNEKECLCESLGCNSNQGSNETLKIDTLAKSDRNVKINKVPKKTYSFPETKDKTLQKVIKIHYASQFGNTELISKDLHSILSEHYDCSLTELSSLEPEEIFIRDTDNNAFLIFILPTVNEGLPPENAAWFCKWLNEAASDFRIEKSTFSSFKYAVFGSGNSLYGDNFNLVAKAVDHDLHKMGSQQLLPVFLGDENAEKSQFGGLDEDFLHWAQLLLETIDNFPQLDNSETATSTLIESSDEDEEVMDVEDLVKPKEVIQNGIKEMITPALRQVLTKQGYKLIGSHSGVKLCRWTKAMLRGRGGCYKHTFYGIESHRCMEATPSLACANKCVFCWRHHSNPVGTEWKWKMDDPQTIVKEALENHYKMIKQFKGVPGVQPEKFNEGLSARHCALSLVGEPIMYPEINKLISLLHSENISTFLVTNAQFPDAIRHLDPVTQLYVSVDASTKESLKKIDRPLFPDFWERFIDSLKALSEKGQRTVYRLTLVKAWNLDEMSNYAKLVQLGKPDFIEVKGVTYCGGDNKKPSKLTMANVPWHEEVISFSQQLADLLPDYSLASEHEHSNCILIANNKFNINGIWHTWIDYEKFHQLMEKYYSSEGKSTFNSMDYVCQTPDWAVMGSSERGFDPQETRWFRKNNKDISGC